MRRLFIPLSSKWCEIVLCLSVIVIGMSCSNQLLAQSFKQETPLVLDIESNHHSLGLTHNMSWRSGKFYSSGSSSLKFHDTKNLNFWNIDLTLGRVLVSGSDYLFSVEGSVNQNDHYAHDLTHGAALGRLKFNRSMNGAQISGAFELENDWSSVAMQDHTAAASSFGVSYSIGVVDLSGELKFSHVDYERYRTEIHRDITLTAGVPLGHRAHGSLAVFEGETITKFILDDKYQRDKADTVSAMAQIHFSITDRLEIVPYYTFSEYIGSGFDTTNESVGTKLTMTF